MREGKMYGEGVRGRDRGRGRIGGEGREGEG